MSSSDSHRPTSLRQFAQNLLASYPEAEIRRALASNPTLEAIRRDPTAVLTRAGMNPDPWQAQLLRSDAKRMLLLCSRQAGKSQTAAALAIKTALCDPGLILILAPSERQAGELLKDKLVPVYQALGSPVPVVRESALQMTLANGARIIALPGKEETVRCFSGVKLLILDEASKVPDALYFTVRPMLSVSRGKLIALSTPWGKRGWFFEAWQGAGADPWHRVRITADQCPRIDAESLREELATLGPRWYRQEYECSFEDTIDAVFAHSDIQAALSDEVAPLFGR